MKINWNWVVISALVIVVIIAALTAFAPRVPANPPQTQQTYSVPAYGAGPRQQSNVSMEETNELLRDIREELKGLRQDIKESTPEPEQPTPEVMPKAGAGGSAVPSKAYPRGVTLMAQTCSACHAESVAEDKGHGLALFNAKGEIALTPVVAQKCAEMVLSGKMPKKTPLSEADKQALAKWLQGVAQKK